MRSSDANRAIHCAEERVGMGGEESRDEAEKDIGKRKRGAEMVRGKRGVGRLQKR